MHAAAVLNTTTKATRAERDYLSLKFIVHHGRKLRRNAGQELKQQRPTGSEAFWFAIQGLLSLLFLC